MAPENGQRIAYLACFTIVSLAVTGYFVGLQAPMNPAMKIEARVPSTHVGDLASNAHGDESNWDRQRRAATVVLATDYADMGDLTNRRANAWQTSLTGFKSSVDPLAEFTITEKEKLFALEFREQNRAFNGAPPTVPHPIDQMSSQACAACHLSGFKTESLRIPKMSHQFLENCTQCHVESNPKHMPASLFRQNSFVGLPAPNGGPRAFAGAPPQIPHSTWMRVDCTSCHGFTGVQGIRTTHPWRNNCQQCHTPSSELDQVQLESQPQFLPSPEIEK